MNGWQKQFQKHADITNEAFFAFAEKLVTLSTGALALSITFRKSFSLPVPSHLGLLQFSWIAFTLVILAATLVQFGRIKLHEKLAKAAGRAAAADDEVPSFVTAHPGWWFGPAKWIMLFSFPSAIIALAAFALFNLD